MSDNVIAFPADQDRIIAELERALADAKEGKAVSVAIVLRLGSGWTNTYVQLAKSTDGYNTDQMAGSLLRLANNMFSPLCDEHARKE